MKHLRNQKGFGMYEVIGIAAVLIVAAFVVIPGFRSFAENIMSRMDTWLETSIFSQLFPST
ncbi:MAG: hypothetical protein R6W96_05805 [Clostridia bacterium]